MPVTFVASSRSGAADNLAASNTCPVPTGAASGDIALLAMECFTGGGDPAKTPTWPTGFTQFVDARQSGVQLLVAWKRLTGADTGNYVTSWSGNIWNQSNCILIRGAAASGTPVSTQDTNNTKTGSGTSITATSGTSVGQPFLAHWVAKATAATTTPPTSFTETQEGDYIQVSYRIPATTGSHTATGSTISVTSGWSSSLAIVEPAGGSFDGTTSGTVTVTSAVTGTTVVLRPTSGTVTVTSTASGTANVLLSGATGTAAITSTVSGSANVKAPVSGTVAITSTASGATALATGASGTVAVTSAVSGAATVKAPASGTVATTSATSGSVAIAGGLDASGTVTVTSATSGNPTARLATSGTVTVTSTTSGSTNTLEPVSGTVTITSTVSGTAENPGAGSVSGTVSITSTASGTVGLRLALVGQAASVSLTMGAPFGRLGVGGVVGVISTAQGSASFAVAPSALRALVAVLRDDRYEARLAADRYAGSVQDDDRYEARLR